MKKKILGILVVTLLITTVVLPVTGTMNIGNTKIVGGAVGSDDQLATWINANYMPVLTDEEYEKLREAYKELPGSLDWYWKPPYSNYAPHIPGGMPDFDQQQEQWKTIFPGLNGVLDSTPLGDDLVSSDGFRIGPGPNCYLDSDPTGDDEIDWSFSGPAAVANCFWWFDSKYADSTGTPGDGEDIFSLVADYGVGDDHQKKNVRELIERLAVKMRTCNEGITNTDAMQDAIDEWFDDTGLSKIFEENTYEAPTFDFIEDEIERSQDVILKLGFWDAVVSPKLIDQEQTLFEIDCLLGILKWWDFQSFTPSVNRLDAIQLLLDSGTPAGPPGDIEINVYNLKDDPIPIGTTRFNPGALGSFTWVQFHFVPHIELTPDGLYYFDVRVVHPNTVYNWWFMPIEGIYVPGQGWMAGSLYNAVTGSKFDWTFKTEYYDPPLTWWRKGQRYVTCAGVNSEDKMIAISDPYQDIENPTSNDHNDAQYVSHDIYEVKEYATGLPWPAKWHLLDYPSGSTSSIHIATVEEAVVICPTGFLQPDLDCEGTLSWSDVKPGSTATDTFYVKNVGDLFSELDWEKCDEPTWGTWTFNPSSGDDLKPEDGKLTVQVTVVAPNEKNKQFTGQVKICNKEDTSDYCIIQVSLATPKNKPFINSPFLQFLENHPYMFPLLRQMLNLQ